MFATTDCSYCVEEYAEVRNVKSKLGEGIGVFTILVYETPDSAREYLEANKMAGTVLVDPEAEATYAYAIGLVPTVLLIDSNGYVNYLGNFTPEEDIVELATKIQRGEQVLVIRPGSG